MKLYGSNNIIKRTNYHGICDSAKYPYEFHHPLFACVWMVQLGRQRCNSFTTPSKSLTYRNPCSVSFRNPVSPPIWSRPLSSILRQLVTCRSVSESLTSFKCSSASFSMCVQRSNMIRSIAVQPFKCSNPIAMMVEFDPSNIWIFGGFFDLPVAGGNAL